MRNTLWAVAAAVLIANSVSAAFAQTTTQPERISVPRPCILATFRPLSPQMTPVLVGRLKLEDPVKTKVTELLAKADADLKPNIDAQRKASEAFVVVLAKPNATESELAAAGEVVMKAEAEIVAQKVKTIVALRALLTSEQNDELSKLIDQYTSPWRNRVNVFGPRVEPVGEGK